MGNPIYQIWEILIIFHPIPHLVMISSNALPPRVNDDGVLHVTLIVKTKETGEGGGGRSNVD